MGLLRTRVLVRLSFSILAVAGLAVAPSCTGTNPAEGPASSASRSPGPSSAESAGGSAQNPVARDERSVGLGRALYAKQCQSCHGPRGRGDGPAAGRLNVDVPDLTTRDVQSETDGELFTIITRGSKPMPAYRRLLNEEQRWHVVNYLRASFGRQDRPT